MINKGAKVCFVVPPVGPKSIIRDYAAGLGFEADSGYCLPPLDLLQMAACIQHKFEVSCIDAQAEKMSLSELCLQLVVSQVQCCIVEISLPTIEDDLQCINAIGKEKIIVIGKIHSQNSELLSQIFKNSTLNCCIVTECEDNLLEILLGNDRSGTASYEEGVLRIFSKPLVSDLDSLPFPLRQLALQNNYEYPKLGHCTTLLSSRGCPYPCGYYCPYPMVQGKKWRHRSPHSIIEELKSLFFNALFKL